MARNLDTAKLSKKDEFYIPGILSLDIFLMLRF